MTNVFFKTYGCAFNQLDSELMAGRLKQAGFGIAEEEAEADLFLINSCTVKNLSESKFFKDIKTYRSQGKKVMVSGCITQAEQTYLQDSLKDISVIGTNDLDKVVYVAEQTIRENPVQIMTRLGRRRENEQHRLEKEQLRLASPVYRKNPYISIIPINEGCLNTCSFCKTKQARGHLFSYTIASIKEAMKQALAEGAKEIYLTSQDTGCYGFDINTNLPTLLRELLAIPGDYRIRIGMGNPNHFKHIIDEVLTIMQQDRRVYRFLHIPLQSGSDRILSEMRRMYVKEDFERIAHKAKLKIPDITLANDIIVAYPTETEEEFQETLAALRKSGTNVLNYSRFWLRPGTPAERMYENHQFIEGAESKRRSKEIRRVFADKAYEQNKKWIGWEGEARVIEQGKAGTNTLIARNDYYKPILLSDDQVALGETVKVRIYAVTWYDFRGEVL